MPAIDYANSIAVLPPIEGVRADRDYMDLLATEARDAQNWLRREGRLRLRPGIIAIGAPIGERPTTLLQYDHDDEDDRIVCATTEGFHHYNKTTESWDDKTGAVLTSSANYPMIMRTFEYGGNRVVLMTNGIDAPRKWDGDTATEVSLGGSPPKARCMAIAFNRVILGHLTSGAYAGEQNIDVSSSRNPDGGWNEGVQVEYLNDTEGDIMAMESIGNRRFGIYMEDAIQVATAIGGDVPFRVDLAHKGIQGPVSAVACIPTPFGHVWLALDGSIRVFDGANHRVLQRDESDDRIHVYIRNTMDWDLRKRSWLAYDPHMNELHVHYAPIGQTDTVGGCIINMTDLSVWPVRWSEAMVCGRYSRYVSSIIYADVVGTYADSELLYEDYEVTRNRVLLMNESGQFYEFYGADDDGTEITHFVETGLRAPQDPRFVHVLRHANHLLEPEEGGQEVTVQFGASQIGEDRKLEAAHVLDLSLGAGSLRETHHKLRGRFFCLRISGTNSGRIEWRGTQVVGDIMGLI